MPCHARAIGSSSSAHGPAGCAASAVAPNTLEEHQCLAWPCLQNPVSPLNWVGSFIAIFGTYLYTVATDK